jgi:hypothetical protein
MIPVDNLIELAGQRSRHKRHVLMRAVADMFFAAPADERTSAELILFDEIMDMVLTEVEPLARRELAQRLAAVAVPPRRTLLKLADDDIAVAEPILRSSSALGDDDLVVIVRRESQPHLMAIAGRTVLSELVTDMLVVHGNDNVAGALAGNDGAKISETGFSALARRAAANDNLLDRLIVRRDLPEQIANDLLPTLAASMRARIESLNADVTPETACDLLGEARASLAHRLRLPTPPLRALPILLDLIDRGDLLFGEAVLALADAGHLVDLAALIGNRLGLRSDIVVTNLFGAELQPAMTICRAAGLDLDGFSAVLRLRHRRQRNGGDPGAALRDYLNVSRDFSQRIIETVRSRERRE